MKNHSYRGRPKRPVVHKKTETDAFRKRTKAGVARFERWQEQFGAYGHSLELGMILTQMSIGGKR